MRSPSSTACRAGAALEAQLIADDEASATTLAQYEAMAAALLDAYRTGTPEAMQRH